MTLPMLVGAQKLFLRVSESVGFARALDEAVRTAPIPVHIVLCPSLLSLHAVAECLRGSPVSIAAQTFHHADGGAHTGQVSLGEIVDIGVGYAMVGHWELRDEQAETDASVTRKLEQCVAHGVAPIVCIGETTEERSAGLATEALERQIDRLLGAGLPAGAAGTVVIAYEPRWTLPSSGDHAIRAGARVVDETCAAIREMLTRFGTDIATRIRILYGGGVNERSAAILLDEFHGDGVLVGRASTRLPAFLEIARALAYSAAVAPTTMAGGSPSTRQIDA